jgi:hypothetical protein
VKHKNKVGKPFLLSSDISLYYDLVEMGFYTDCQTMSQLEMLQLWLDRKNRQGFDYEVTTGANKKDIKHDYPFLVKS